MAVKFPIIKFPDARVMNLIERRELPRAVLALAPLLLAALVTGDAAWLQASLVTISTFIAVERSGVAPLGVVLHGIAITAGFMILVASFAHPTLFVISITTMAAASILVTTQGAELRWLGAFTFIPGLYLACELGEQVPPSQLVRGGLDFLPIMGLATIPVLLMSSVDRIRSRGTGITYLRHFAPVLTRTEAARVVPYWESAIAVALAVAVAAAIVETCHIEYGHWMIWSAASVVTGDAASARLKLRDRLVGVIVGVPAGVAVEWLLPHDRLVVGLTAFATLLTFVAFRRYVIGFGARCVCVTVAVLIAGQSTVDAGARLTNVILGGLIGIVFVLGVHAIAEAQARRGKPDQILS